MKRMLTWIILTALSGTLLCACAAGGSTETADTEAVQEGSEEDMITFVNELTDLDVWILPNTEENRRTTLWGTATLGGMSEDEERQISFAALEGEVLYLVRVIDTREVYYAADSVRLEPGCTVRLSSGDGPMTAVLEVTGADGTTETYVVFAARL